MGYIVAASPIMSTFSYSVFRLFCSTFFFTETKRSSFILRLLNAHTFRWRHMKYLFLSNFTFPFSQLQNGVLQVEAIRVRTQCASPKRERERVSE